MDGWDGLSHIWHQLYSPPLASLSPKRSEIKDTHHGVYMFERKVAARCLFRKDRGEKGGKISISKTHLCGTSCCITLHHLLSFPVQAPLSTIPCPNVAWSRVQPHLECVGPSIIPPCKYLHKIDKSLCNSQKQSPSVEPSFPEPYTAMSRERGWSQERQMLTVGEQKIRAGSMRTVLSIYQKSAITMKKKR